MSFGTKSSPPPSPAPLSTPTPTPTPSSDGDVEVVPQDAATDAATDSTDESVLADTDSILYQFLIGDASSMNARVGGWDMNPQEVDSYSATWAPNGAADPYVGFDVDPYTNAAPESTNLNAFTGDQNVNPLSGVANGPLLTPVVLDTSQLVASDGPAAASNPKNPPPVQLPYSADRTSAGSGTLDGTPVAIYHATIDGVQYTEYYNDKLNIYQREAVPTSPPAPASPSLTPAPTPAPQVPSPALMPVPAQMRSAAPTASSLTPSSPPAGSWTTAIGDFFAGIAGLFGPSSVGPYLHPRTPADLGAGLTQMGQMNAAMAQQSMQASGVITRRTMVAAGLPYAMVLGALAAPAVADAGAEGGLRLAARFPNATATALDVGNALTGTSVPRAAIGVGGVGAAAALKSAGSSALAPPGLGSGQPGAALPALASELAESLPRVPSTAATSTEAAALFQARDEAVGTASKLVQQELAAGSIQPAQAQARFGTWLDALAKTNVRQAVAEGRLPSTFVTSPTVTLSRGYQRGWISAPDVWDTASGRAWDFMPAREPSFYAHESLYLGSDAFGRLDPTGTTITEVTPLFHLGFRGP
ncbi:MAG TPA: hypothetical protein VGG63_18495 [Steroidobacteraceae bacterium]|jgi:hypothetical protein